MTVLITDVEEAQRLAAALDEVRRPDGPLSVIAVPPVRGLAFFADEDQQPKLDRWWAHAIPRHSEPIHLVTHEDGIAPWLPGLDGRFVVGAATGSAAEYRRLRNVTVAGAGGLLDIARTAVGLLAGTQAFRDDATLRLEKRLRRVPAEASTRFRRARLRAADEVFLSGAPAQSSHHPIPNVPAPEGDPELAEDAGREDIVRALADTLRRLQRIRSAT